MSAFTDFNGPCSGPNLLAVYDKLNNLASEITLLESELNALKGSLQTGDINTKGDITSAGTIRGVVGAFDRVDTNQLDVHTPITVPGVTTHDIEATGNIHNKGSIATDGNLTVKGYTEISDELKAKALEVAETLKAIGNLEAANAILKDINAENIHLGVKLNFDKVASTSVICGHYYVLAKTRRLENTAGTLIEKPGTAFIVSPADPHIKLLVNFTSKGLSCTYTKLEDGDTTVFSDHNDGTGKLWPGLALGLYKDNNTDTTYLVLYGHIEGVNGTNFLGSAQFKVATINCDPVTDNPTITPANEVALIELPEAGGFVASNMSFRDLTISGTLNVAKLVAEQAEITSLHATGPAIFDDSATFNGIVTANGEAHFLNGADVTGTLNAEQISAQKIVTVQFEGTDLVVSNATIDNGTIKQLTAPNASLDEATAKELTTTTSFISNGEAIFNGPVKINNPVDSIDIVTANIENAIVQNLDAIKADIDVLSVVQSATFTGNVTFLDKLRIDAGLEVANGMTADRAEIETAVVDNGVIDTLTVSTQSTLNGTTDINDKLNIAGTTKVTGSTEVLGPFHAVETNIDTANTTKLVTADIVTPSGNQVVKAENDIITVGSHGVPTHVASSERPTVLDNNIEQKIAYLSDITNSVVYMGVKTFFANTLDELPTTSVPTSSLTEYTVKEGDTALFSDGATKELHTATFTNGAWVQGDDVVIPTERSYQYSIRYQCIDRSDYWVRASLLWSPNADTPPYVHILELPVEDFYTKAETNSLFKLFVNGDNYTDDQVDAEGKVYAYAGQNPTQPNWLDERKTVEAVPPYTGDVPNPAFIQNRPAAGISVFDGGSWDGLNYPNWQSVVDGGDFTTISGEVEKTLEQTVGDRVTYPETIWRITHGTEDTMPTASANTRYMLKFCTDTNKLYIDSGDPTLPDTKFQVRGNLLLASFNPDVHGAQFITDVKLELGTMEDPTHPDRKTGIRLVGTALKDEQKTPFVYGIRAVAAQGDNNSRVSFAPINDTAFSIMVDVTDKLDKADVVDNLMSTETGKALSANMGRVINSFANRTHSLLSTAEDTNLLSTDFGLGDDIIVDVTSPDWSTVDTLVGDTVLIKPADTNGITAIGTVIANLANNKVIIRVIYVAERTEVIDSLDSDRADAALSAAKGRELNELIDAMNGDIVPAGCTVGYFGPTPNGFLACSGSNVSKTKYNELYEALKVDGACPYGEDFSTFTLPDIHNMIISVGSSNSTVEYNPEGTIIRDIYGISVIDSLESDSGKDALSANMGHVLFQKVQAATGALAVRTGTLIGFFGDTLNGYLKCNGQAVSKETYADLYGIIGSRYGETDSTFNLPTIDNMFIGV